MYERHFGLQREPFSIAPDPRLLYMSERHREALAHLLYGVGGGGGFVVLTGEVGTGKTTVCRAFLEQVPPRCRVAYIFNPALDVIELLRTVCAEFRIPVAAADGSAHPTRKDHVDALNEYLLRTHAAGFNNVLVIDEAQALSAAVLEQLRLLTNLETNERKLLQIVLIGQPELRALLARPEMEQLAQRVIARYHLAPLDAAETVRYVAHRLAAAGRDGPLPFDRGALARLVHHSRGVPRRINLLADRALLGAYALGRAQVDRGIVDRAAAEVFGAPPGASSTASRWARRGAGAVAVAVVAGVAAVWLAGGSGGASRGLQASAPVTAEPAAALPAAASAVTAVTAPPADASVAPSTSPAPAVDAIGALRARLAAAPQDEATAWAQLARRWGIVAVDDGPCAGAADATLHCHRGRDGTPALLRELGRPAIVVLRDERGPPSHAVLVALDEREALLRLGDDAFRVPVPVLAGLWTGAYATLWRAPGGYRGQALNPADPPTARWLAQQLDRVGPADGLPVRERLRRFQAAHGLPPDGLAGPLTLMQLNRAAGVDEPRLDAL
jgi:general secretion pathway protein A